MKTRAAAGEATRQRVLDAAIALMRDRFRSEIRLDDLAADAGVSTQTVLNLYGSKNHLLAFALVEVIQRASKLRRAPAPGDISGAIEGLYDHYESVGDWVVRNVFEGADPELLALGRRKHRDWVQLYFGSQLAAFDEDERERRFVAILAACDVLTWKLLRRDLGHSQAAAQGVVLTAVKALIDTA